MTKRLMALLLAAGMLVSLVGCALPGRAGQAEAGQEEEPLPEKPAYHNDWDTDLPAYTLMTEYITVDAQVFAVRTYFEEYASNRFVSLRDMSRAMEGSAAPFAVTFGQIEGYTSVELTLGAAPGPEAEETREPTFSEGTARYYPFRVDGQERRYMTAVVAVAKNVYDAYLSLTDLCMILDISAAVTGDQVTLDTHSPFALTLAQLTESGFFDNINGVALGSADTGEIWYDHHGEADYPIGSTTKLMTYAIAAQLLREGKIHLADRVSVSQRGQDLSQGIDGVLRLKAGDSLTVEELLYGMLVCSSNECTLTLAEHIAGSEAAFAVMMQDKAAQLGMDSAVFYNCHGLPLYTKSVTPGKVQNRVSARDMFTLAAYLLREFPEITTYTAAKEWVMPSIDQVAQTTNMVLYNVENVVGLKTGTTNKAGYCLITAVRSGEETLLIVMLGAESGAERIRKSEVLARCLPQWAEERNTQ